MERKCPECGEEIIGRIDKKFCSDQCRSAFNNGLKSKENSYMRTIDNTLKKNRKILEKLNTNEKTNVHKNKLIDLGFDFRYITGIYTTKNGRVYYCCYEHWYLPLEDDYYLLVINNDVLKN